MKAILSFIFTAAFFLSLKAQQYKPSDEKSDIGFTIKNFGINTSGSFKGLKGSIKFDASNISSSSFNVSVDVNTINTGIDARDNHLKKEDYFDVAKHPSINFTSTNITANGNQYSVTGNLTIKGVTKSVSFPFTVETKDNGITLNGSFSINRKDFNVGGSSAVLSNSVTVNLKVYAAKQ